MATVSKRIQPPGDHGRVPPLEAGDRLTRTEFERRYEAMPDLKKAELIEGVFPGLWLDPAALVAGDAQTVLAALSRGLATPEHTAFVARLNRSEPLP
jgi:hypothetical protein